MLRLQPGSFLKFKLKGVVFSLALGLKFLFPWAGCGGRQVSGKSELWIRISLDHTRCAPVLHVCRDLGLKIGTYFYGVKG